MHNPFVVAEEHDFGGAEGLFGKLNFAGCPIYHQVRCGWVITVGNGFDFTGHGSTPVWIKLGNDTILASSCLPVGELIPPIG